MHSTQLGAEVPTRRLAESLVTIAENAPEGASAGGWTTLCLALASQLGRRGKAYKSELELPGKASEIAWKKSSSVPAVLSFSVSYNRSGGEITGRERTEVRVSELVLTARDQCDEVGVDYAGAGRAAAEAIEGSSAREAEEKLKRELEESAGESKAPNSSQGAGEDSRASQSPGTSTESTRRSDRGTDRRAGGGTRQALTSSVPSHPCPYGCDIGDAETAENRRLQRSDLRIGGGSKRCLERHRPERDAFKTRGSRAQRRWLDARARMPAERLLFLELLRHARRGIYQSGEQDESMDWVGVKAEEMESKMGAPYHSTWKVWEGSELIEARDGGDYVSPQQAEASDKQARTREFRIPQDVLDEFTGLAEGSRRWWLQTAEPARTDEPTAMSSDLKDENGNYHPDLIDKALRVLDSAEHRIDLDAVDEAIDVQSEETGAKARARLSGLQLARETISRQADGEEGVVTIQNAYTPDDSGGRISFKRGGPQGMLKAVKARAYDLEGCHNYDIRSCHTAALKQLAGELEELGVDIDTSPLDEYPDKYVVADDTGLPVGLVKTTEHSVKNSAYLPASLEQAELIEEMHLEEGRTLQIVDAARKADVDTDKALSKLHDVFADYRRVAIEIAEALLTTYWDEHKQPGGPAGWCMKNHAGVSFYRGEHIEDEEDDDSWCHDARTAVMAWALRGLEAAFCHSITILSAPRTDFDIVANEHDGLIAKGKIPSDIIQKAREMSGFTRADLVEKPFADADDIAALYGDETDAETAQEKPEGKAHDAAESGAEDTRTGQEGLDPIVRRHLQRKRKKRRERLQGAPDEVVAQHTPSPGETADLSREEVRRMRGRNDSPPEPAA